MSSNELGCATATCSPFASRSIVVHLLRGAAGVTLLILAFGGMSDHPMLGLAAGAGALVALRGCPMCWMIGLVETVVHVSTRRTVGSMVADDPMPLRQAPTGPHPEAHPHASRLSI